MCTAKSGVLRRNWISVADQMSHNLLTVLICRESCGSLITHGAIPPELVMRISVVFVAVIVITTPAPASAACMSIGEARQHFGSVHLYWHGLDHCWDASPGRRRDATKAEHHAREQKRAGSERPKWRDARSELVANNAPAQADRDTNDQPVATADTPPIRIAPVRRVSFFQDWSERWVDIEQIVAAPPIKATSPPIAAPASEQNTDLRLVVRGLALFMFGFGLVRPLSRL